MRRFDRHAPLHLAKQHDGRHARLAVRGEIDIANADLLEEQLLAAEGLSGDELIVDLSGVTFIDVAGARVLVLAAARAAEASRQIRVEPSPPVARLLSLLGAERQAGLAVAEPAVAA